MSIRKAQSPKSRQKADRTRVKIAEKESLLDVSLRLYGDRRVAALLEEMNPDKEMTDKLESGTSIVIPSKTAVQKFAGKMGFVLGVDHARSHGTQLKKKWSKMKSGLLGGGAENNPVDLADLFISQNLHPDQAARRLLTLVPIQKMKEFLKVEHSDLAMQEIQIFVQGHLDRDFIRPKLKKMIEILKASQTARGRRYSLLAAADNPEKYQEVFPAFLISQAMTEQYLASANIIQSYMSSAKEIAQMDTLHRDVAFEKSELNTQALGIITQAIADKVEPLSDKRLASIGLFDFIQKFEKHLNLVLSMMIKMNENINEVSPEILKNVRHFSPEKQLPKPWPVVATVMTRLGTHLDMFHAGDFKKGFGAFNVEVKQLTIKKDGEEQSFSVLQAADLAGRAVHSAAVLESHEAIPKEFAPVIAQLFHLYRPTRGALVGSLVKKQQRLRVKAEKSMLEAKGLPFESTICKSVFLELCRLLKSKVKSPLHSDFMSISEMSIKGAENFIASFNTPLPLISKAATPTAKAILLVSMLLDDELSEALGRESGQEKVSDFINAYGTRILSFGIKEYLNIGLKPNK